MKTAIIEGDVVGGTCVNRGCVPSKALLAVSGRMRELQNEQHMKALGLQVIGLSCLRLRMRHTTLVRTNQHLRFNLFLIFIICSRKNMTNMYLCC